MVYFKRLTVKINVQRTTNIFGHVKDFTLILEEHKWRTKPYLNYKYKALFRLHNE